MVGVVFELLVIEWFSKVLREVFHHKYLHEVPVQDEHERTDLND